MEETAKAQIATCFDCRQKFEETQVRFFGDQVLCQGCWDNNIGCCDSCNEPERQDNLREINDKWYCEKCVNQKFFACSSCGDYFPNGSAVHSEIYSEDYCSSCASECLYYCVSCDYEIDHENCYRDDGGDRYCDSCWDDRESDDSDDEQSDFIQNLELWGTSFKLCTSKRKYGVEIEACLENESNDHLSDSEVGTWSSQHDGSLGAGGREYASAILQGDDGFNEIETFTAKLKSYGYVIRKSCGLHVHIDGRDLECEDIRKLLKTVLTYEPVIYAMLPEARFTGSYSVPLTKFPKSRFRTKVKDENDLKSVWYGPREVNINLKSKYHHSRYYGVNIHSWFFRRSIEFRYHSGTLNPLKITNFIKICQALVDRAHAIKSAKVRKFESFQDHYESFITFLDLPAELGIYIKQRIMKFHPDRFGLAPVLAR